MFLNCQKELGRVRPLWLVGVVLECCSSSARMGRPLFLTGEKRLDRTGQGNWVGSSETLLKKLIGKYFPPPRGLMMASDFSCREEEEEVQ